MNFLFFASIVLPNWEQGRVDMVVILRWNVLFIAFSLLQENMRS